MRQMDFFYFFGSGYAYLSVMRIEKLAREAGVSVRWRPINVRPLMQANNVALRTEVAKIKYLWRDIERRAASHGVPFTKAPIWPTDPDLLANLVGNLAREERWCEAYSVASFKAWFLEGQPLGSTESVTKVLRSLGQDPARVIAKAKSVENAASYAKETEEAGRCGVFGSPSFVVDGELFWGDDRLEEAIAWAAGKHRLLKT